MNVADTIRALVLWLVAGAATAQGLANGRTLPSEDDVKGIERLCGGGRSDLVTLSARINSAITSWKSATAGAEVTAAKEQLAGFLGKVKNDANLAPAMALYVECVERTLQRFLDREGTINQSNNSGNSGIVINGNVTLSGGTLQRNAPGNTGEHVSSFKLEKYVDVRAARVAGATNVAIALHRGTGPNSAPLEDALRQTLSKRGFSVIPFFREPFRREGLVEKLYGGDPELAGQLMLRRHCDSVLLGVLRFSGPAENVDGLYFREAVLDIHAIDPGTGQVVSSLEIRQKGGGSTAELSTVNAMIRLEEAVEASLSEWSWI